MALQSKSLNRVDFLQYLGAEETNLHVSLQNLRSEFDAFEYLDDLYQKVIESADVRPENAVVMQLFIFIHYHLYFSVSTFFRCHFSESFNSCRSAIDAALIAYRIIEGHGTDEDYIKGEATFQFTPSYIRNARKKDPSLFPWAEHLLKVHSQLSRFASHADFAVFSHRLKIDEGDKADFIQLQYFQKPETVAEMKFYFLTLLHTFVVIASVYEAFFVSKNLVTTEWPDAIKKFGSAIEQGRTQLRANTNFSPPEDSEVDSEAPA